MSKIKLYFKTKTAILAVIVFQTTSSPHPCNAYRPVKHKP